MKNKKIIFIIILTVILMILLLSIKPYENKTTKEKEIYSNNNKELTKEEIYKDMKFTNIALITEKGYTTFTATVTNEGEDKKEVKFHIELLDKNKKVIIKLLGYIPGEIKKGESKDITATTQGQLKEVVSKRIVD